MTTLTVFLALGEFQYKSQGSDTWNTVDVVDPATKESTNVFLPFLPKQIAEVEFDEKLL